MNSDGFMKGNEAMAEAAIMSGCRYYFGYPITPAERGAGLYVPPHARSRRGFPAGGIRSGGHQYGLWRGRGGRAGHDFFVFARHLA